MKHHYFSQKTPIKRKIQKIFEKTLNWVLGVLKSVDWCQKADLWYPKAMKKSGVRLERL